VGTRELSKIIRLKPEPQTTPSLEQIIQSGLARETVANYRITPTLREHFKRVFECVVHRKGQGFWVQAEYGAGKTHFLGTLLDLLLWPGEKVWEAVRDDEFRREYSGPAAKVKLFPVAFSLRGMGQAEGGDSLMRVFEEQVRESLRLLAPELNSQVQVTSAELAAHWYAQEATEDERAGVSSYFQREHRCRPEEFRSKQGVKKFGQELVRSRLPEGRLRGKYKERFAHLYDQITQLGGYDGLLFVVDEFRSWQDRHPAGTAAYAEDEEILETLAFVLPSENRNVLTLIASQGDMPQKLSGGGRGDRFIPLYLLADKNKNDFGEIVVFRCRDLPPGPGTTSRTTTTTAARSTASSSKATCHCNISPTFSRSSRAVLMSSGASPRTRKSTTCPPPVRPSGWPGRPFPTRSCWRAGGSSPWPT
jgi:hypothetical protein